MLVFWVGVVLLAVWGIRWVAAGKRTDDRPSRALEILEERFARGEIDLEEFERRRSLLERR